MAGLIVGVWAFAEAYAALGDLLWSGEMGSVTLADLLEVPFWALAAGLVLVALVVFWLVAKLERRPAGGDTA